MQIVENPKALLKASSVWVAGAWAGGLTLAFQNADSIVAVWNALPPAVQTLMPAPVRVVMVVAGAVASTYAARIIKQPSVSGDTPK
jgi:hypothetical protein